LLRFGFCKVFSLKMVLATVFALFVLAALNCVSANRVRSKLHTLHRFLNV